MEDQIAWVREGVLARSSRPGWWDEREIALVVREWIARVKAMGVNSIVCFLSTEELVRFYGSQGVNLFASYREAGLQIMHIPVTDREQPPLEQAELFQLRAALSALPPPWLVHCSAGIDRTGCAVRYLESKPELLVSTAPVQCKGAKGRRS